MKALKKYFLFITLIIASSFVSSYAQADRNCTGMIHTLDSLLQLQVPEIDSLGAFISETSEKQVTLGIYIHKCPDPNSIDTIKQNYYEICIGEDGCIRSESEKRYIYNQKPSKLLFSFFIKKDLKETLYFDPRMKTYLPIDQVRQTESWKNEIDYKRRWVALFLK